jgi:hypothetical protein
MAAALAEQQRTMARQDKQLAAIAEGQHTLAEADEITQGMLSDLYEQQDQDLKAHEKRDRLLEIEKRDRLLENEKMRASRQNFCRAS